MSSNDRDARSQRGDGWRWYTFGIVVLVIVPIALSAWVWVIHPALLIRANDAAFQQITIGMTETALKNLMGPPTRTSAGEDAYVWSEDGWYGENVVSDVDRELWYTVTNWYLPVSHVFGVDADGVVVAKTVVD